MERNRVIAFDARLYGFKPTGIGRWTRGLLQGLVEALPHNKIVALGPVGPIKSHLGHHENLLIYRATPTHNTLWQLLQLPKILLETGANLFLSPFNLVTAPFFRGTQVAWIHDLIPFSKSGTHVSKKHALLMRFNLLQAKYCAHKFIAVSHYTKRATVEQLGLPEDKISVVYPGISDFFFKGPPEKEIKTVREKLGMGKKYILAMGGSEPRKNMAGLIEGWAKVNRAIKKDRSLLVIGGAFEGESLIRGVSPRDAMAVRWIGRVSDPDLLCLLKGAELFVYPSLEEGFGLPPLEAMALGVPVLASDCGAILEVSKNGAAITKTDSDSIGLAIELLLGSHKKRDDLVKKGKKHVATFTWKASVEQLISVLHGELGVIQTK